MAVPTELRREELHRRGVLDREASNPRQDFKRTREVLLVRSLIAERDGLVWMDGSR